MVVIDEAAGTSPTPNLLPDLPPVHTLVKVKVCQVAHST